MKKALCIILLFAFLILCGCEGKGEFKQEVTITKPNAYKTSDNISIVDEVLNVLGLIEKAPIDDNTASGTPEFVIKINVDGKELIYSVGEVFVDADGKKYKVTNIEKTKERINEIYDKISNEEVSYQ